MPPSCTVSSSRISLGMTLISMLAFLGPLLCAANPNCTVLTIPLTAEASNEVFPIPTGFNFSAAATDALVQTVIGNADTVYPVVPTTFTGVISARYCKPTVKIANRTHIIQFFMSGVTENKLYWSGLGYPQGIDGDEYSTIAYASSQGYHVLAIDRIGVGNSAHPDPILQLQVPLEEAVSHELVLMLKAGTAVPGVFIVLATALEGLDRLTQLETENSTKSSSSVTPTAPFSETPKPRTTPVTSLPSS